MIRWHNPRQLALAPGTRLGVYEVTAQIGAGGMGEVYKGRDTRLDRTVAIKILPDTLGADPEFRERFDREARTISRLTHPNICTLYDIGEQNGTAFLVMELLEGETLEARLARAAAKASGLPLDEALRIAIQIADALAAAHRQGIVHRDLKPGNVFLVRSSAASAAPIAKLLDFGLARTAPALTVSAATMMPTTPPKAITAQGTILGTFQYMAPEQVEGQEADARTDIFAFGSVLYEMLTGNKAFEGKTQASLIAAILERDPPSLTAVQPLTPSLVGSIVGKCLAKNPDERWQTAADLASALRWASQGATTATSSAAAAVVQPRTSSRGAIRSALEAVGILAALAIGLAVGARYLSTPAPEAATVRFEVQPPADVTLSPAPVASAAQLAFSPDGRRLAFVAARRRGVSQLWIRALDGVDATALPGTEGVSFPFWSPDSRSLAFFAAGKLKKVDTAGGTPQVLCDAASGRGGAWTEGTIVFAGNINSPLSRIADAGGIVTPLTTLDPAQGVISHYFPQFLPDGRHFLYYQRSTRPAEHGGAYVGTLDSSETARVLATQSMASYSSGFLWYSQEGTLFATAFDVRALRTTNEPIRVADGVGNFQALGYAAWTVSATGVLAHGPAIVLTTSVQQLDRSGTTDGARTAPGRYRSPRLSPDQKSVAMAILELGGGSNADLWVFDLARGIMSRVTSDPGNDWFPVWPSDSRRLFFGSNRMGFTTVFEKTLGGKEELFAENALFSSAALYPLDVSGDERFLLAHFATPRGYDLGVLTLAGERKASVFLSTPFNEVQGRFSPNGRWIAYASDESGRFEVYVRPFPVASGQTQISIAGGVQPEWRQDGKELFYLSADGKLTAVPVTTDGPTFTVGAPRVLFDVEVPEPIAPYPSDYAVTADGQRFFVNTVVDQPTRPALTVVVNWAAESKK
jgi:serine/threonine protein kinase/Tol biopolymer transport system component